MNNLINQFDQLQLNDVYYIQPFQLFRQNGQTNLFEPIYDDENIEDNYADVEDNEEVRFFDMDDNDYSTDYEDT
jgi:hypothetical protein